MPTIGLKMEIDRTKLHRELMEALRANRDKLPPRIAAQIDAAPEYAGAVNNPWAKPEQQRSVAVAALFILRCTYGQIMALFAVSQSTVYSAITRHVPNTIRKMRGKAAGKPLIPYELATQYYQLIGRAGTFTNAVQLAAKIQELAQAPDEREIDEGDPYLHGEAGTQSSRIGEG